jgi:hypothetical protein
VACLRFTSASAPAYISCSLETSTAKALIDDTRPLPEGIPARSQTAIKTARKVLHHTGVPAILNTLLVVMLPATNSKMHLVTSKTCMNTSSTNRRNQFHESGCRGVGYFHDMQPETFWVY